MVSQTEINENGPGSCSRCDDINVECGMSVDGAFYCNHCIRASHRGEEIEYSDEGLCYGCNIDIYMGKIDQADGRFYCYQCWETPELEESDDESEDESDDESDDESVNGRFNLVQRMISKRHIYELAHIEENYNKRKTTIIINKFYKWINQHDINYIEEMEEDTWNSTIYYWAKFLLDDFYSPSDSSPSKWMESINIRAGRFSRLELPVPYWTNCEIWHPEIPSGDGPWIQSTDPAVGLMSFINNF